MYTRFLGFRCCDIFNNILNLYGNITTVDLEANNQWMKNTIDASLKIDKHFEHVKKCIQHTDDVTMLYTAAQVPQKAHHAVLAPVVCVDDCEEWIKKTGANKQGSGSSFFVDEYHNIKITQKLSTGQMGRCSTNYMFLMGDIPSTLDKLNMAATANQRHAEQMMGTIHQMTDTNKILGEQINQISEMNMVL